MSMGRFPKKKMHFLTSKDSLKFELLAFRKKYTPFVDKMHFLIGAKKNWAGASPSPFGQCPKECIFFLGNRHYKKLSSVTQEVQLPTETLTDIISVAFSSG